MMGLFSGKSDHPLADAKSARELFERLKTATAIDVVDEVESWTESVCRDHQIKPQRRIDLMFQLHDVGASAARNVAREYLKLSRTGHGQNYKLWHANRKFWQQLAASYESLLEEFQSDKKLREELRSAIPILQLRLLKAYGGCLKWDQFRYGPIDPALWFKAGRVYLDAEKSRSADKMQGFDNGQTTIGDEYLRLVLFHAASMDRLQPVEIELAEQFLERFLGEFGLTGEVRPENVYWVDASIAAPPTRLAKLPNITPTLRFLSTTKALTAIEKMLEDVSTNQTVPAGFGVDPALPIPMIQAVLQHLAIFCSPQPPMRSHVRHQVKSWMRVVDGLTSATAALLGNYQGGGSWAVEDVSRGGMRAMVELGGNDHLGIGSLVAMCPDGGENWLLGIVRRISRASQNLGNVGIETIGRTPMAIRCDGGGTSFAALSLESRLDSGGVALLVVPPEIWQDLKPLRVILDGKQQSFRPLEVHQSGSDYVVGRYWIDTVSLAD